LIKEKLKVTKIPKLKLADDVGNTINFNQLYEYQQFLGAGGFGFVVQAVEKKTGETMALKVSHSIRNILILSDLDLILIAHY
jgi:serine/threonine protein kinase